jgi:nitrite reductase/ring-hydroxylating ferredoxin subunit
MGPASAQLIDELGYDPDDGVPDLGGRGGLGRGRKTALAQRLKPGDMIAARVAGQRVAMARLGSGRLVVVADECPHDGGRISDGFVDGERLVCARHGWELEARNGRCERACKLRE